MKRFNTIFEAPIMSRSGYGAWSDILAKLLIEYPRFDTIVSTVQWGDNAVRQNVGKYDELIKKHLPKIKQIPQPHIYACCILPNLAKPQGTIFNINFSAGLEVNECTDEIMNGLNQFDLNIVLSEFTKQNYINSKIKPTKPIETLMWAADTDIYKPTIEHNIKVDHIMDRIVESEAFLCIGQNTSPQLFADRKNISNLIKDFCETFNGKANKPALILKTSGVNSSNYDRDATITRLKMAKDSVPNNDVGIYLVHGELSEVELNTLYNHPKVIANVNETRGEGWSGPLLEGSLSGTPTICTNYSGHLEFLPTGYFIPLEGQLEVISQTAESCFYIKGSKWFEVDHNKAKEVFTKFYYDLDFRAEANKRAKELVIINAKKFNVESMRRALYKILDKYLLGV